MAAVVRTRTVPRRPPSTLECQRVGGCSARVTVTAILVVASIVATSLFCVWSRTETVRQGYAISDLAGEIRQLSEEQERIRAEVARLRSPERIETIAVNELGMQYPKREQIRIVGNEQDDPELIARVTR